MKQKVKPESKIPTTQTNTNQKKKVKKADGLEVEGSLLKKNEFTLIIVGALVVTVLVFFLFFRTSEPDSSTGAGNSTNTAAMEDQGLEKRISALEVSLTRLASFSPDADASSPKNLAALEQRISRLETAVTLKLDSMIERMGKMEKRMGSLKKAATAKRTSAPVTKTAKTTTKVPEKAPVKKKAVQPKKTTTTKKASLFHTVKKGETLWSISQKYKTSVSAIRKLNNLSAQDKIYPGNNILVR